MNCLYINSMLVASFTNIFSYSIGCLFTMLIVSFVIQTLLSLIRSHLFIFVFISFGDWSQKILLRFMPENVLPMFSSRSFMVSCLIFMSLNYFELNFVYGVRECSNFVDLAVQLSQKYLLTRLSFLHCIFLTPLSLINLP